MISSNRWIFWTMTIRRLVHFLMLSHLSCMPLPVTQLMLFLTPVNGV